MPRLRNRTGRKTACILSAQLAIEFATGCSGKYRSRNGVIFRVKEKHIL